jgi:hypothetical protein
MCSSASLLPLLDAASDCGNLVVVVFVVASGLGAAAAIVAYIFPRITTSDARRRSVGALEPLYCFLYIRPLLTHHSIASWMLQHFAALHHFSSRGTLDGDGDGDSSIRDI